jgi:hypothetical protein
MPKKREFPLLTLSKGHWSSKKKGMVGGGKVKDREAEVKKYLRFLGLDKKTDLMILLDPNIKTGEHSSTISINPNLSDAEFVVTLAHEFLHYKGLPHNCDTIEVYFNSKNLDGDILSKTLAMMLKNETR